MMNNQMSFTEQEMFESQKVCETFDFSLTEKLASKIGTKRIIFAGMGSSMIFPAKQAKNRALKYNISNKVEAYFASDLFQFEDFSDTYLFLCSNSGKTKEVILLLEYAQKHGAKCVAVTAVKNSILAQRCDDVLVLKCGFEKGVAATKSVIEQGLIYDSIIFHLAKNQGKNVDFDQLKKSLKSTGALIKENIEIKIPEELVRKLAAGKHYFFVGLDTGVAEEITLKSYEITRKMALFYPDTHLVHGVEEAIEGDAVVIFEPKDFADYLSDFEKFRSKTGSTLVTLSSSAMKFGQELIIKSDTHFNNYCTLASGWGLLRSIASSLGIDIDHPVKATKVGNAYQE